MLAMKNRKYLPKKPWKRFTSAPLPENADWHLFVCSKIRISKKWEKRVIRLVSFLRHHPDGGFAAYRHVRFRTMCPKQKAPDWGASCGDVPLQSHSPLCSFPKCQRAYTPCLVEKSVDKTILNRFSLAFRLEPTNFRRRKGWLKKDRHPKQKAPDLGAFCFGGDGRIWTDG